MTFLSIVPNKVSRQQEKKVSKWHLIYNDSLKYYCKMINFSSTYLLLELNIIAINVISIKIVINNNVIKLFLNIIYL